MYNPTLYQQSYNNPPNQPTVTNKIPSVNSINLNLKNPHLDELRLILDEKIKKSQITNKN